MRRQPPHHRPAAGRRPPRGATAALLLAAAATPGCYDGQTLVDRARNHALRTRVEAVSLGRYSITMPLGEGFNGTTEVQTELFGRTVRYKVADVEREIEEQNYRLRQAVMLTVRSADDEAFADPDLAGLRQALLAAVHEALGDDAISSIGFHDVRFIRH